MWDKIKFKARQVKRDLTRKAANEYADWRGQRQQIKDAERKAYLRQKVKDAAKRGRDKAKGTKKGDFSKFEFGGGSIL